jgi:uncharacterized membrane protein HdeD (DUF308 family)
MSAKIQKLGSQLVEGITENAGWAIGIGVLCVITGLLAIMAPYIAGLSVTIMVGALLTVNGVLQLIFAFKTGSFGKGLLTIVLGILGAAVGVYMMLNPNLALLSLTLMLAAYFVVAGISEIVGAFKMRPVKGWVWAAISAVISVLLGVMIWGQFPASGIWAVGTLTGIRMVFGGIWLVAVGRGVRGASDEVQVEA